MPYKSADWIYSESNGTFTSLDLLTPAGEVSKTARFESSYSGNVIVVSSDAPSDSDGRPDGTIYIQTA